MGTNHRAFYAGRIEYEIPDAAQHGGGQIKQSRSGTERPFIALILFLACLFSGALPSERSFYALFFAGLQVEGVTLDLLDDVFLLHLALETAQGIFQRLILLNDDFSHCFNSPPIRFGLVNCAVSLRLLTALKNYLMRLMASSNQ